MIFPSGGTRFGGGGERETERGGLEVFLGGFGDEIREMELEWEGDYGWRGFGYGRGYGYRRRCVGWEEGQEWGVG